MKKQIIIGIVGVLVLLAIIFNFTNRKEIARDITVGMIAGVSGAYASVGESFSRGVDLAQEEWNKTHPELQVFVIKEDDAFESKRGLAAYHKLTSIDKVDGIVNMSTITIDSTYSEVVKSGIPFALGFEQGIDARMDNVIQLWPGTVPAEVKLGQHVKAKGFKNLALFVDDTSLAFRRFADGFKEGYGDTLHELRVPATDRTGLKAAALKAVEIKPDAVVFIVTPTSGALLIKELASLSKADYQFIFDANVQTGFPDYKKVLGDTSVLDGSILYVVPTAYRTSFDTAYKNKFGVAPTIGSETGYNSFMLLVRSYDPDKAQWVKNMQNASFEGADGQIVLDKNGVRIPELKLGVITNGELPN